MRLLWLCIACLLLCSPASAAISPVAVRTPMTTAWIGQRVSFSIDLRATSSFEGAARFELPQLEGVLLIKIGTPVVGSEEIDGESVLVQSHEFALFSQQPGTLAVPPITVRFASHDGFTGPVREIEAQTPEVRLELKRPPGSEQVGFLLTTESLEVTESWEPQPQATPVPVGAMFKRTIVQRAVNMSGMALTPPPAATSEGIRIYPGEAQTKDTTARGDFFGERRETLTYLLTQSGVQTLPALTYTWWNPKAERLESTTLPAVTVEVVPAPASAAQTALNAKAASLPQRLWPWLLGGGMLCLLGLWQKFRIAAWKRRGLGFLHRPDRVAARRLLAACGRNDIAAAETAWFAWLKTQGKSFAPDPALQPAIEHLYHHRYGVTPATQWQGEALGHAFTRRHADKQRQSGTKRVSSLPVLNP